MEKNFSITQSTLILKQRDIALAACAILLVSNLLLAIFVFSSQKEIVLVPNSLDQDSSIRGEKMSKAYLEALARDYVALMLNVNPTNVEYNSKAVLKIVHPQFYGDVKLALNVREKDVFNRKISTYFSGQSIIVGDDQMSAIVIGKLSTFLGKEEVSAEEKNYAISFKYEGYKPLIINFQEVDSKGNPIKAVEVQDEKKHN